MQERLTGESYRKYWRDRMAKGAAEASFGGHPEDVDPQAALFFGEILKRLPADFAPQRTRYWTTGCAW